MEGLIYWWALMRMNWVRGKDDATYRKLLRNAKTEHGSNSSELIDVSNEARMVDADHDFEISRLQSNYLIRQADRMFLPIPSLSDKTAWEDGFSGFRILSREARVALRGAIRKERHEASQLWIAWAGPLTGLGGVVVAIIALLVGK